jgi:hypothetical protein
MTTHQNVADHASEAAGNWRKFGSFAWHDKPADADRWFIWNTTNRDADLVTQSNHAQIAAALEPFTAGDDPDVRAHSASHWAVGWVEGFEIRVYGADGSITEAYKAADELICAMADYPILSDEDFSEREHAALCDAIAEVGRNMTGSRARKGWPSYVAHWLHENEQGETEDTGEGKGAYPSEESVRRALGALRWLDRENAAIYRAEMGA